MSRAGVVTPAGSAINDAMPRGANEVAASCAAALSEGAVSGGRELISTLLLLGSAVSVMVSAECVPALEVARLSPLPLSEERRSRAASSCVCGRQSQHDRRGDRQGADSTYLDSV